MARQGARKRLREKAESRQEGPQAGGQEDGERAPKVGKARGGRERARVRKHADGTGEAATAVEGQGAEFAGTKRSIPGTRAIGPAGDFEVALAAKGDTSEKLFELANRPAVRVAVAGGHVEVVQDHGSLEHSGGVVWETAYFLLRYLQTQVLPGMKKGSRQQPLRVVEVGAGCGLLGLALARLGCDVLLTEQPLALPNLKANTKASNTAAQVAGGSKAKAAQLSWGDQADVTAVCAEGPFDLVVGTDVVFATRLVRPLLETIAELLKAQQGPNEARQLHCWLCLQKRDADAHELLLKEAPKLFQVEELSFEGLPGFEAAVELECLLLHLQLVERKRPLAEDKLPAEGASSETKPRKRQKLTSEDEEHAAALADVAKVEEESPAAARKLRKRLKSMHQDEDDAPSGDTARD
ncbi:unnamed protein product, partial [Polarella glacialis]